MYKVDQLHIFKNIWLKQFVSRLKRLRLVKPPVQKPSKNSQAEASGQLPEPHQDAGAVHSWVPGARSPLPALPPRRSADRHHEQPTPVPSGHAISFKRHFCLLRKSTLVTWINPLRPERVPGPEAA